MRESFTRAADDDRAAVAQELLRAHADGRLTLAEFDERTRAVYEARTYAELDVLTADLPRDAPLPAAARTSADPKAGTFGRVMTSGWFVASSINIAVWGVVSFSQDEVVYPWWIWVAGPWGLAVLLGRRARFGRSR